MHYLYYSNSIQKSGDNTLLLLSLLIYITVSYFGGFTTYANYIIFPIVALWIPFLNSMYVHLPRNEKTFTTISIVFLLFTLIYRVFGYSTHESTSVYRDISWIMSGIISVYALRLFSKRDQSTLFLTFTLVITILLVVLISIGRAVDVTDASETANAWVGSMFMLLTGFSLIVFIHVKPLYLRAIFLSLILLTLYLNFYILQRGTNVIFTIFEIGLIIVFSLKYRFLIRVMTIGTLITFFIVYTSGIYIQIFDWLADVIPSERLAERFLAISYTLQYGDVEAGGGSLEARDRLMHISWNTFTSNIGYFLFGAGAQRGNTVIGHHSFFLDTLASYGIIGGFLMIAYFKKQYQIIMSKINREHERVLYSQCTVIFVFYLLRNFYGDMSTTNINFMLLIYFPLVIKLLLSFKEKK